MGVVHGEDSWFVEGGRDVIDDVGLQKVKVQLVLSSCAEGEPAYLAFDFALMGSVPVILGASGSEFHDMIAGFQFAGEFAQMIAQGQHGLSRSMREDDGIGVKVQDLLGHESTQAFPVEFEASPAGGETGHEDVDVDLDSLFFVHALVDNFDHLVVHDAYGLEFPTVVVQESVESDRGRDGLDLTLVPLLPVLAPETVEHHLGQGLSSGICLDLVGIESNPFLGPVVVEVLLTFFRVVPHPLGPTAGFLLDFQEGVHVRGEHGVGIAREMPDLVHVLDAVALIDGFLQFGGGPRVHQTPLSVGVPATVTAFGQRFGLFLFDAGSTEGEGEFAPTAVG